MFIKHKGKIWQATKLKNGYKLTQPIPQELIHPETVKRFCEAILKL